MEKYRKKWNDQQKQLRQLLEKSDDLQSAIDLFLIQHAMVHSAKISKPAIFSFEDEILSDLSEESFRQIPKNGNHSIAWIIWHLARIEDVTMNLLIADKKQVIHKYDFIKKLHYPVIHTGNGMSNKDIQNLSNQIDIKSLIKYRQSVGRETRKIVRKLKVIDFKQKVDPQNIQRIWDEKAMLKQGKSIVDYWSKRTISGLLLMPLTRHCFLHLNEARHIKSKI